MLGTLLGAGGKVIESTRIPCPHGTYTPVGRERQ